MNIDYRNEDLTPYFNNLCVKACLDVEIDYLATQVAKEVEEMEKSYKKAGLKKLVSVYEEPADYDLSAWAEQHYR